ncbi:phage repressor protein [Sinirhodobacter populi]|nr:phage repressor protein [Sinirhodobacter populi]
MSQLENAKRQPGPDTILLLCDVFGVGASDLIEDESSDAPIVSAVAIAGDVGAGAEVDLVDAYAKGDGKYLVECPPMLNPHGIVGVEVKGDSMEPTYSEGDVLFYTRTTADGVPIEVIGRKVVAETEDGMVWVKQIKVGTEPGLFHLLSLNPAGRNMLNVRVKWAASVRLHLPHEFVKRVE